MSAFDSGLTYQIAPGLAEYPHYDVDIVSPELPCGSAWLVNCLLELGVPVWKPWNANIADEWQALGARRYRYACADEPWLRALPALRHGRIFHFYTKPVPRVQHAWPHFYPVAGKTIFFARDPRDALYSAWQRIRRAAAQDINFVAFASGRYHHYPLSFSDYALLFLRLWQVALREREHLVVRYEDYRENAIATLQRVTTFLGIEADDSALQRATAASSFENLRSIEDDLIARGAIGTALNRAGRAREYRETFDAAMHAALGPRFAALYDWLGYEADRSNGAALDAPPARNIEPLLRAMLGDRLPAPAQAWLREKLILACADIALDRWPS